jgi:uncharacterized membrane protein
MNADNPVLKAPGPFSGQVHPLDELCDRKPDFGERLADRVAAIGGSWSFIMGFGLFLMSWAVVNSVVLATRAFDPFPYIFLNLMLSMLAALQAPVIMMSQNRHAAKDRMDAQRDYETNVRAEEEIASLHEKIDRLLARLDDKGQGVN